jgi:para-nitrobenzyl esterase
MTARSLFPATMPVALALAVTACGGTAPAAPDGGGPTAQSTVIATKQGAVSGTLNGTTRTFLGIPFAAPPVGPLRFHAPEAPAAWTSTLAATNFGPSCPQFDITGTTYDPTTSEDCLTVNVWTPSILGSPRPVMVWIFGGGFILGAGSQSIYDGTNLSQAGDVVVVNFNYRLGPLGFLSLPSLDAEDPASPSGNYGIEDQRAALTWVQENIAAFGGDPGNVTLFGESAGGGSTAIHMVSPASAGLFQRAIIESGFSTIIVGEKAPAQAQGATFAETVGCADGDAATQRACLRAVTPERAITALPLKQGVILGAGVTWGPIIDGVNLTDTVGPLIAAGKGQKVPLIVGANSDEGTLFVALAGGVANEAAYAAALEGLLPAAQAEKVLAQYPVATYGTAAAAATHALDDVVLCDARRTARLQEGTGAAVYYYEFTYPFPFIYPNLGAFHSAELPFVWGNEYEIFPLTTAELPLSAAMQGYWTRHAAAGDPNTGAPPGALAWPPYATATDENIVLGVPLSTTTGLRKAACDFWDALGSGG